MLNYDPKDAVNVLPVGEYRYVIDDYEEKLSKKGNEMGVVTLKIYDPVSDKTPLVTDYIVLPAFTHKLKGLAKSLGREEDFNNKTFQPSDYVGSGGRVLLEIESQPGYDDKNVVKKYIPLPEGESAPKFAKTGPNVEIPFGLLIGFCLSLFSLMGAC